MRLRRRPLCPNHISVRHRREFGGRAEAWLVAHPDEAVPALIAGLGQPAIRRNAARVLGRIGAPEAVSPLQALMSDGTELDAHAAAMALAQIPDEAAHTALLAAVDAEGHARKAAVEALGARGDSADCALLTRLLDDPDAAIAFRAARAAHRADCLDKTARSALRQHPNPEVRELAEGWD